MRNVRLFIPFIAMLFTVAALYGQGDPQSTIRDALTSKYGLTTTTADKTAVVSAGSELVLKKSNFLAINATSMLAPSNTYKGGHITQGFMGHMASGAAGTRTFVAGEKLWVTSIDVKKKGIVFSLFSDSYSGVHYRGTLMFPFGRGGIPSAAAALAVVDEVFDTDQTGGETGPEHAPGAGQQVTSSDRGNTTESVPNPPPPDNTPWNPSYGRLAAQSEAMQQPIVQLETEYLRHYPSALNDKAVLQQFIALNNCNDERIGRALKNELDAAPLLAYYRQKAPAILAGLPHYVTNITVDEDLAARGPSVTGWHVWAQHVTLGEYDVQRHAFPFKTPGVARQGFGNSPFDGIQIPDSLMIESNNGSERAWDAACPVASQFTDLHLHLPQVYALSLQSVIYKELPMDEEDARKYIDAHSGARDVYLLVDFTILPDQPELSRDSYGINVARFHAKPARVRVVDFSTRQPLATLYDDHSIGPEIVATAKPQEDHTQEGSKPNKWAASDHLYEIRAAVVVSLESDACSWPLTPGQSRNLNDFLRRVSHGYFSEREQYAASEAKVRNTIAAGGRQDFCANPAYRREYDKLAARIAPRGRLAAPKP